MSGAVYICEWALYEVHQYPLTYTSTVIHHSGALAEVPDVVRVLRPLCDQLHVVRAVVGNMAR